MVINGWNAMQPPQAKLRTESFLWQLLGCEKEITSSMEDVEEVTSEVQRLRAKEGVRVLLLPVVIVLL